MAVHATIVSNASQAYTNFNIFIFHNWNPHRVIFDLDDILASNNVHMQNVLM